MPGAQTPSALRGAIRDGDPQITHTSGLCPGHLQANLVILPLDFAADFDRFVAANSRACPLLYRSAPGETGAPPLAASSDVRRDVPRYRVHIDGVLKEETTDITGYWRDDLVAYYFGCSFTFENALQAAGVPLRNVEQGRNVSMYLTTTPCVPAGPFHSPLVVSMRPIPPALVTLAVQVTAPLVRAHGAPVHIGDPGMLVPHPLDAPDFGDPVDFAPGDVPVFWACGVTSAVAAIAARPPLCITHSPGSMFVCDSLDADPIVRCLGLDHRLRRLEEIIIQDPGHRGVAHLLVPGDLALAARSLSAAASVGLVTGFPCVTGTPVPYETDGPPGIIALAEFLLAIGKKVVIVGEPDLLKVLRNCSDSADCLLLTDYPPGSSPEAFLQNHGIQHLVAVERSGRATDGRCYTMRGRDITALCAPLDELFAAAMALGIDSTGVGDGGNEVGMQKVHREVALRIPMGAMIACATATTFLVTAGVSNWGAFALIAAVGLVTGRTADATAVLQVPRQSGVMDRLVASGVCDGTTGANGRTVDGLPFDDHHAKMLTEILEVLQM